MSPTSPISPIAAFARVLPRALTLLSLALVLAIGGSACSANHYYVDYDEEYADEAPPPPRAEPVPVSPGPAYVWLPGYWYWTGRAYVWRDGRYARPPAQGHVWVRSGWVYYDGRYRYVPGRWARPGRVPQHHYVPRRPARRPPPVRR